MPTDDGGGVRKMGAQHQHLADVRVRRPRLRVQVVTVVPDDHETEVVHRRESGGAGTDDRADHTPAGQQEAPVTLGRTEIGGENDVAVRPEPGLQRGVDPSHVTPIGDDDHCAPPARDRGRHELGDLGRPGRARQRWPHRARRPPVAQRGKKLPP